MNMRDIVIGAIEVILLVLVILAVLAAGFALMALLFQFVWNISLPFMFGVAPIDFWQSVGFLVVLAIIGSVFKRK